MADMDKRGCRLRRAIWRVLGPRRAPRRRGRQHRAHPMPFRSRARPVPPPDRGGAPIRKRAAPRRSGAAVLHGGEARAGRRARYLRRKIGAPARRCRGTRRRIGAPPAGRRHRGSRSARPTNPGRFGARPGAGVRFQPRKCARGIRFCHYRAPPPPGSRAPFSPWERAGPPAPPFPLRPCGGPARRPGRETNSGSPCRPLPREPPVPAADRHARRFRDRTDLPKHSLSHNHA